MKKFLDQVALNTEHHDVTRIEALMDMRRAAIAVYDGTDEQEIADWARPGAPPSIRPSRAGCQGEGG